MKTFNNSDLFTGYLKQLLHTFHLPKIKVYTKEQQQYRFIHGEERPDVLSTLEASPDDKTRQTASTANAALKKEVRYFPYIKDGEIQEYVNNKWQNVRENEVKSHVVYSETGHLTTKTKALPLARYVYGEKILNYTKNLKINSNLYDSYTHEYLGDYLRFHRDFLGLNLMPLYNCFSNRACEKLNLQWNINNTTVSFTSNDPNFKIYMLPVKLFQKYTIAIDSATPIELCCGLYGDYQDTRAKFINLPQQTYMRVATSLFSQPFLYDTLDYTAADYAHMGTTKGFIDRLIDSSAADKNTLIELAQSEQDLKLFIKVPINNTSTITVLEGDYRGWNDSVWNNPSTTAKRYNKSVINLAADFKKATAMPLITPLQLLQFNTRAQHPFSDRLIEYLIGNTITPSDTEISDNITRAQKALASNYNANGYIRGIPGIWSEEMRLLFYEYMTTKLPGNSNYLTTNRDLLGYVDKDVEKYYQATLSLNALERGNVSLSNIELEEGDK